MIISEDKTSETTTAPGKKKKSHLWPRSAICYPISDSPLSLIEWKYFLKFWAVGKPISPFYLPPFIHQSIIVVAEIFRDCGINQAHCRQAERERVISCPGMRDSYVSSSAMWCSQEQVWVLVFSSFLFPFLLLRFILATWIYFRNCFRWPVRPVLLPHTSDGGQWQDPWTYLAGFSVFLHCNKYHILLRLPETFWSLWVRQSLFVLYLGAGPTILLPLTTVQNRLPETFWSLWIQQSQKVSTDTMSFKHIRLVNWWGTCNQSHR